MADICAFKRANLPIFCLVGGPGAGKASQAEKLKKKFGYTVVNMGAILRDEVKTGSCRGSKINDAVQNGDLAPQDVTMEVLKEALARTVCAGKPVLIVGFPRTACQKRMLEREIAEPRASIFLDVSDCTMKRRQQSRGGCNDQPETVERRVSVFGQQTRPMIEDMINCGRLIRVDGEQQPEQVFCAISKAMECQNSQMSSMQGGGNSPSGGGGGGGCGGARRPPPERSDCVCGGQPKASACGQPKASPCGPPKPPPCGPPKPPPCGRPCGQ